MNIFASFRAHPFIASTVAVILAVAGIAGGALAWGPDRDLFTAANPADHITFNSIKDNPSFSNETNFFRAKLADADNSTYSDKVELEPGKEYQGYVYFHNNAAANLKLVAENTTMRIELPAVVDGTAYSNAFVGADNAKHMKGGVNGVNKGTHVFDDITLTSKSAVAIRMVPGSAVIHSQGAVNQQKLSDALITDGVQLGYDKLDGKLPGCNQYAGYVLFRFVADQPDFTVEKKVSKHNENKWSDSYKAQPGETVDFLLKYKNTGTTLQKDVVMRDELPKGMSYVKGSTTLGNPTHPQGKPASDTVTTTGLNVGSYNPGQNAWVLFSAKVDSKEVLECGIRKLTNKLIVETNNGSKSDTAEVTTEKDCEPTKPEKIEVCEIDTGKIVTIDKDKVNNEKHASDLAKCDKVKVCDTKDNTIVTIDRPTFDKSQDRYTTDLSRCKSQPETPDKLPETGAVSTIAGIFGAGSLAYATALYVMSRRQL